MCGSKVFKMQKGFLRQTDLNIDEQPSLKALAELWVKRLSAYSSET